jgi:aspartate kinase
MPKGRLVVQKFGGTSVENTEKIFKISKHIRDNYWVMGTRTIVVVSAMGKDTDKLMKLANEISKNPNGRELDQLLHTGEDKTASLLAMALNEINVPAISLMANQIGLIASSDHGKAKIKGIKDRKYVLNLLKDNILIVAGFQGVVEGSNDIATLGRGGSDATAVALAAFMDADLCEIYTDVDGIYCVDPRIVSEAKRLKEVSYEQMYAMAAAGAGVLFDRSVKIAQRYGVPLKVLLSPSRGESDGGTIVTNPGKIENLEEVIYARGLAVKKDLACFNFENVKNDPGEASKILKCFSDINIIDLAQVQGKNTTRISVLVESKDVETAGNNLGQLNKINWALCNNLVALTLIDPLMKEGEGYGDKLSSILGKVKSNIEMMTSSQQSISVVIKKKYLEKSCTAIAKEFDLLNQI